MPTIAELESMTEMQRSITETEMVISYWDQVTHEVYRLTYNRGNTTSVVTSEGRWND